MAAPGWRGGEAHGKLRAMSGPEPSPKERKKRRQPKPATPERLHKAALYHLDRYASSAENLRRLLLRRVERSARLHDTDPEEGAKAVENIVRRLTAAGILDDRAYAASLARRYQRGGASARAIRGRLRAKGVGPEEIDQALEGLEEDTAEPELAAALAYARRRRIGPYRGRAPADREEAAAQRERELAALGRRGFPYEIARKVVEAEDAEALEEEAAG